MKTQFLLVILFLTAALFYVGCDSATDSKAVGISPPVLNTPPDGDTTVSVTPVFAWTNEADKLEIDENAAFSSPFQYNVSGTQFTFPSQLVAGKWYYWRAGISSGTTTYWSQDIYHFRTLN